ncbi:MAG TPA: WD40 repeat domain-containing protein, partial [Tepidisphaeraceae bacterium]|nr:WD40 repeat domain-containing protein [Tepidisphaeraceae bacterium]
LAGAGPAKSPSQRVSPAKPAAPAAGQRPAGSKSPAAPSAPAAARPAAQRAPASKAPPKEFDLAEDDAPKQTKVRKPPGSLTYNGLPILLMLIGYALPLFCSVFAGYRSDASTLLYVEIGAATVIFFALAVSITVAATKIAANVLHFELFDNPYFRIAGVFAAIPAVMMVLSFVTGSDQLDIHNPMVVWIGALLGTAVTALAFQFESQIEWQPALLGWLMSLGAFAVGVALTFAAFNGAEIGARKWLPRQIAALERPRAGQSLEIAPQSAEAQTADNLTAIYNAWVASGQKKFPASLDSLKLSADNTKSPFGHPGSGPDYVYLLGDVDDHDNTFGKNVIFAYDAAELERDGRTTILTTGGKTEIRYEDEFHDLLDKTNRIVSDFNSSRQAQRDAIAQAKKKAADAAAALAQQQRQQQLALQQKIAQQLEARKQQQTTLPPPPPKPVAPVLVSAASAHWKAAAPDPVPYFRATIAQNLAFLAPTLNATDVLYPRQYSNVVGVGQPFDGSSANPNDVHEVWGLDERERIGRIVGPLPLSDAVISPDGAFIAGLASGGSGDMSVFQVWSFRTGKVFQTIAQPPSQQNNHPRVIGFRIAGNANSDEVLILGDGLDICEISTGNVRKHVPLDVDWATDPITAVSPMGKLAAIWDATDHITLIDVTNGKVLGTADFPKQPPSDDSSDKPVQALAFSPDGKQLAAYGNNRRIVAWSVLTGQVTADHRLKLAPPQGGAANDRLQPMNWLPDSSGWLLRGTRIVDLQTGASLYRIPDHQQSGADEYGPRRLIDDAHVLMSFRGYSGGIGFLSVPIPADLIAKARQSAQAEEQQ